MKLTDKQKIYRKKLLKQEQNIYDIEWKKLKAKIIEKTNNNSYSLIWIFPIFCSYSLTNQWNVYRAVMYTCKKLKKIKNIKLEYEQPNILKINWYRKKTKKEHSDEYYIKKVKKIIK